MMINGHNLITFHPSSSLLQGGRHEPLGDEIRRAACGSCGVSNQFVRLTSSELLQPASLMQAEKYSIFDAVTGPLQSRRPRKRENCNTSHAKTSIYLLQVLKTSRRRTRAEPPTLPMSELWVPGGGPNAPRDAPRTQKNLKKRRPKIVYFSSAFSNRFFLLLGPILEPKMEPKSTKITKKHMFGSLRLATAFCFENVSENR